MTVMKVFVNKLIKVDFHIQITVVILGNIMNIENFQVSKKRVKVKNGVYNSRVDITLIDDRVVKQINSINSIVYIEMKSIP